MAQPMKSSDVPRNYNEDAGIRLSFDTITDRGHDPKVVREALDNYEGDLWFDVFGPAIDRVEELVGLDSFGAS